jgi:hypothetical protein
VLATLAAAVIASLAILVARAGVTWQKAIAVVLGLFGLALIVASTVAQFQGLGSRNQQLISEGQLGDSLSVFKGIILAAAPASIFALRLGSARPSRRTIAWSGFFGLWLPMVLSISLAAVAKMLGASLYWRPSAPINNFPFAFAWLVPILRDFRLMWILLTFIPLVSSALWLKYLTDELGVTYKRWLALLSFGVLGFGLSLTDKDSFAGYYLPWCWSILFGSLLLGVYMLVAHVWRRFRSG